MGNHTHVCYVLQVGDIFVARVTARVEENVPISAADVQLQFDQTLLRASNCVAGSGVRDAAGFECRFNMPGMLNSVQMSHVEASAEADTAEKASQSENQQLSDLELALVTFQVCISFHQ